MKRSQNSSSNMSQYTLRLCCCLHLLHVVSKDVSMIFSHYPFPSCCAVLSCSALFNSLGLHELQPARLLRPCGFSGQETGVGSHFLLQGIFPSAGIEPRSPSLRADSLPSEPTRKPKNIRVGSPSCLQGIFLTLESNWDLLHCRKILYQLRYQGNPSFLIRECFYHQY